ncbi:hypothetical protein ETD86_06865 [Nonomuraea turkmeniaca]|uniref:DNA primase n=1 Tax=Nonomuraea turkmeniaca TaxID=103838 RepID=A0A5S4FT70_9ACTN|nr:hypothetical protein [Nonomuraea turkmeniaca]TMR23869.1 hypothetical protein ETD86_06865 [Nonomuraea turkmeniaca]
MKDSTRVALAIAAGYYLGRRHKLRLAAALVAAGVAGRMRRGEGGGLLEQGIKALGATPELEDIFGRIRGDLTEVGKAAAVAATSKQIDTLSSKLHDRAEALRTPSTPEAEHTEEEPYEEEEPEESPPEEPVEEPVKAKRRPHLARTGRR